MGSAKLGYGAARQWLAWGRLIAGSTGEWSRALAMSSMNLTIRNETEDDYRAVEEMVREAFWNLYVPGCSEHFVLHNLRSSVDFIPELDFVAEREGRIVA